MMTISRTRRGSALLVVLGMLAFMLFSGLAFSVYMRQSRLPTSFLRRSTTTRQLAKAALAEAIEDIDQAIGNDPHPGVRRSGKAFSEDAVDNFWSHRVFIGKGASSSKNQQEQPVDGTYYPAYSDPSDTVPVLTLEGLAYLPPNLINEARYYFQRSPTAEWHSFWFDSGRYAYAALDVSDYFDVNRIFADKPRAACGSRRISFAHLFEAGYDHSGVGNGAADWDKLLEKFRAVDDNDGITYKSCPFVSLADFNMAWGVQSLSFGGQSLQNPFCSFVENGGVPYNCGESETDEAADKYRMMTFVTDGWFPTPATANAGTTQCNLEDPRYQPFKREMLEREGLRPSVRQMATTHPYSDSEMLKWFNGPQGQRLTVPDCAALWDYLDVDSIPVSLCMPTVERTPMICGMRSSMPGEIKLEVNVAFDKTQDQPGQKGVLDASNPKVTWDYFSREVTYKLDVSSLVAAQKTVQVLLAYPFQEHGMTERLDRNFKVDGRFSVFLTRDNGNSQISIRPRKFSAYPKDKNAMKQAEVTEQALLSFPIREQSVTPKTIVEAEKDCPCYVMNLAAEREFAEGGNIVLAKVKYTWPRDKHEETQSGPVNTPNANPDPILDPSQPYYGQTTVNDASGFGLYPLTVDGDRMSDNDLVTTLKKKDSFNLKANVAVWIRVRDKDDYVVDMVPACHIDDQNMKVAEQDNFVSEFGGDSSGYPLLRTVASEVGNNPLTYSLSALHGSNGAKGSLGSFTLPDAKLIVSDPRYNYASENWVKATGGNAAGELKSEDWFSVASAHANGTDRRDGDVYMATSDAGYMQSIYELAFLPRMCNGFNDEDFNSGHLRSGLLSTSFGRADYATAAKDAKDYGCMWRTYSPFGDENDFADLEELMVSGSGTKVNPYSDSAKVLMAAFANTPHDWCAASTNNNDFFDMDAKEFNKKHAWNAYSSDEKGKLCWDCLEEFAEAFKSAVRSSAKSGGTWEDAFADLNWATADKRKLLSSGELDGDDSDLYCVDKKFFYGFWRDCFAARQQLFLVFVRAEPMMMGGGVLGQTPPQLGARAVALVWRDPTKTRASSQNNGGSSQSYAPHRTRILFYHQFD